MQTSTKWALGIGGAAVVATGIAVACSARRHRRGGLRGFAGSAPVRLGEGEVKLPGKIECPIYRRYTVGGSSNLSRVGEYLLPGLVQVRCKGEGAERRCAAYYPDCPGSVEGHGPVLEGQALPAAAMRKKVAGLHLPEGINRGRDNAGAWNTTIEWEGKRGWAGRDEKREHFQLQAWDDKADPKDRLCNTVFFSAGSFSRLWPRGDLYYDSDFGSIDMGEGGRAALAPALREAAGKSVGRWGDVSYAELQQAPPIRLGGAEVDWPRQLPSGR